MIRAKSSQANSSPAGHRSRSKRNFVAISAWVIDRRSPVLGKLLIPLALLLLASSALADPQLREQRTLRGGFTIIGNTLAQDCGPSVPAPISALGSCGMSTADTGADVYWRADEPISGAAVANTFITVSAARSTAVLSLPAGAEVVSARLYWSSRTPSNSVDATVNLAREGVFAQDITADATYTQTLVSTFFAASADITFLVQQFGPGPYRLSGLDGIGLLNLNDSTIYAGWWMVVVYRLPSMPLVHISWFDGFDFVADQQPAVGTMTGFLVPVGGTAKLGVVATEGDSTTTGDAFQFNGVVQSNAARPSNNFFNSSRNDLGSAVTVAGDLPALTGTANSYSGLDMAVIDVTSAITTGQSSAPFGATTSGDIFGLTTVISAITTSAPEFSSTLLNSAVNLSGRPLLESRVGDILEFTVSASNTGSDTATATTIESILEPTLQYVPGSLAIVSGANAGNLTDASGDDQAEFNVATQTVMFRLGPGANAATGGQLAPGAATSVKYRATVIRPMNAIGRNVATIRAQGLLGAPLQSVDSNEVQFNSDELLKDGFE